MFEWLPGLVAACDNSKCYCKQYFRIHCVICRYAILAHSSFAYSLIVLCAVQEAFQASVQMLVIERLQRPLACCWGTETFFQVNIVLFMQITYCVMYALYNAFAKIKMFCILYEIIYWYSMFVFCILFARWKCHRVSVVSHSFSLARYLSLCPPGRLISEWVSE